MEKTHVHDNLSCVRDSSYHPYRGSEELIHADIDEVRGVRHKVTVDLQNTNGGLVVVIGINPSIAGKKDKAGRSKSDKTLTKTSKVMHELGFGRLVMVNLFESQTSHTENINFSTQINLGKHRELFDEADEIFVAWGRKGWLAPAIGEARKVLAEYEDKLWCIEHNGRKPFHPRAWAYNDEWEIVPFSFGAVSF